MDVSSCNPQRQRRRAFIGATSGHLIEWYDYGVYGFLALYIGKAFFVSDDPTSSLLASFAAFALSFFIRPLGGLFFGPLADRIGRRRTLITVLVLMAGSTFLLGLLPTYASIGAWAPFLLLVARLFQGLSVGGEYGTTATYMSEVALRGQRGLQGADRAVRLAVEALPGEAQVVAAGRDGHDGVGGALVRDVGRAERVCGSARAQQGQGCEGGGNREAHASMMAGAGVRSAARGERTRAAPGLGAARAYGRNGLKVSRWGACRPGGGACRPPRGVCRCGCVRSGRTRRARRRTSAGCW